MPEHRDDIEKFRELLQAFEDARLRHSPVGAGDTDPREIGYDLIYTATFDPQKLTAVPQTAEGWQLYTPDEADPDPKITPETCAAAAKDLYETCSACVAFLLRLGELKHADVLLIQAAVRFHCG
jgi:hypothetical protein